MSSTAEIRATTRRPERKPVAIPWASSGTDALARAAMTTAVVLALNVLLLLQMAGIDLPFLS